MCCFSIISKDKEGKDKELHLQANSERERNQWLLGLHEQLISSGKKVVENKRRLSGDAQQPEKVPPLTNAEMRAGKIFDVWSMVGTNSAVKKAFHVFYHVDDENKLGDFYWCEP